MCFRPAEIALNQCPKCGASNKPIAKVCEQCGAPLEMKKIDADADQAALDASISFGVPAAPRPPSAPAAPQAPDAPAPSQTPGAPSVPLGSE